MKKALLTSIIIALIPAVLMMQIAWEHNPQGEIHLNGNIDWSYLLLIGFSWFLPAFIVVFIVISAFKYLSKRNAKNK